jgi:hypothetical protein
MDFENQALTTDQAPLAKSVEAASFTPGPWEVETFGDYSSIYTKSAPANGGDIICNSPDPVEERSSFEHWQANARLIAAAPELMSALVALLRETNNIEVLGEWEALDINFKSRKTVRAKVDEVISQARAAIKKATGQ